MKDQYLGDINDYRKYGLLRSIIAASGLRVMVACMLTHDDRVVMESLSRILRIRGREKNRVRGEGIRQSS